MNLRRRTEEGHPSGALVHRRHPKHMEMESTFGEGGQEQDHRDTGDLVGPMREPSHGLSVVYEKTLNTRVFQCGKGLRTGPGH